MRRHRAHPRCRLCRRSPIKEVQVLLDPRDTWRPAGLIGLEQPYAWSHRESLWDVKAGGDYTIMARATHTSGRLQPETTRWHALGCGNNGVREHAVLVRIDA